MTGRIYDRLVQRFGKEAIFKDVDNIPLGVDFRQHIDSIVKTCDVVLVVIGSNWLGTSGEPGKQRLDDPRDLVRLEVESALRRNIPIIPLLVQNAPMPSEEFLPSTLKEFAYRNGMTVGRDPNFHSDVDRLIRNLEPYFPIEPRIETQPSGVAPVLNSPQRGLPPTPSELLVEPAARIKIFSLYFLIFASLSVANIYYIITFVSHVRTNKIYEAWIVLLFAWSLIMGTLLGSAQAILLRKYIRFVRRWIFATILGSVITGVINLSFLSIVFRSMSKEIFLERAVGLVIEVTANLPWLLLGIGQWVILRKLVSKAWRWVVVTIITELAFYALSRDAMFLRSGRPDDVFILAAICHGCLIGITQGLCLFYFHKKEDLGKAE